MGLEYFKRKIPASALAGNAVQTASVTITAAQVATLRAAPKTLVAAPGAGKVLEFVSIALILKYVAPGWTESSANLAVKFKDGTGVQASQTIETTGFIDQTANTETSGIAKIDVIAAQAACENQPLVLHNLGAAEYGNTGGSGLVAKVTYRVHSTGW